MCLFALDYRIALTADVSIMYRAIKLVESDRDLHRFVWRSDPARYLEKTFYIKRDDSYALKKSEFCHDVAHLPPLRLEVCMASP